MSLPEQQNELLPEILDKTVNNVTDNSCVQSSIASSSPSTDSEISEETFKSDEQEPPVYAVKMLNFCKDLLLFTFVAVVTYAALTNEPPKISKSPAAYPFFSKDSNIIDWYRGHLSNAIEHARTSDIAFVLFYAPWDAESQSARKQFELTAKAMQNYVTFAAVNCWHSTGECRNKYNKVYGWPVLIVYPTHGRGIQYNGPIIAEHMIKFLLNVCFPLKRLPHDKNKLQFEDAFLTVNVNVLPGSFEYAVIYSTALKYLEKDPYQNIKFYINPQGVNLEPSLSLHLWNETLIYPIYEMKWRPDVILQWLFKNLHQVTRWIQPTGSKSYQFSNNILPGPSLILFTPFNPLQSSTDYYNMLQQIGQEYYNCELNIKTEWNHFSTKRLVNLEQHNDIKLRCSTFSRKETSAHITTTSNFWTNNSKCIDKFRYCDKNPVLEECLLYRNSNVESQHSYETSMLKTENDPQSIKNLLQLFQKEQCLQYEFANKYHKPIFENDFDGAGENIFGSACEKNQSLSLVVIDSLLFYHFAEKLGVNVFEIQDKSAVVIVDEEMETHYIMKEPISSQNVRNFIFNFTKDNLQRSLKSIKSISSKNTHEYSVQKNYSKQFILDELSSQTYMPTILQKNKAVIIFYYSKQCSYCNGVSYIFLTAAKQFNYVENIQFARIDGELHILPWEFTMDSFPTIILYPQNRKSDSVAFPQNLPITVENLIGFILTNLEPQLKLQAMWSICSNIHFNKVVSICNSSLRIETLTVIEKTLKQWRLASRHKKSVFLYKLKQLRNLYFHFMNSPKNIKVIANYFTKLNVDTNSFIDYSRSYGV